MPPGEDLPSLGATGATLVLHLAVQRIEHTSQHCVLTAAGVTAIRYVPFDLANGRISGAALLIVN